jgi:hypothetical protein
MLIADTPSASEADIVSAHISFNHHWIRRKLELGDGTIFHRQCSACGRDFIMNAESGGWRAVHVGLFGFDLLDEQTSRRWLSEECPGQQLPQEINDRRMHR